MFPFAHNVPESGSREKFNRAAPSRAGSLLGGIAPLLILCVTTLILLSACGRYQVGRHAETPFRSIYVKPVSNESFAPQAQALLTLQVREAFIHDGLVMVERIDEADAVLEITLRNFQRHIAATRVDDTALAEKLRLELTAVCTLSDSRTGKVFFQNREILATADAFPDDRSQQAEYQSMPVLTQNLARGIAYQVLQVW